MIARNDSALHHRGKLDLVGWERDVLCFIEVQPRSNPDLRPAEAAVDRDQQRGCLELPAISCARCPVRASGGWTWSPYTRSTDTANPHSSCFKMRFPYRTIGHSELQLKGFSTCLN